MSITTIMTMLDGAQRDQIDLEAAGHPMSRFDCHCDLLHVRRDPITALPMIGEGMSADLVDIVQAQVEKDEALRAEECQVVFKFGRKPAMRSKSNPQLARRNNPSGCWM